jgi:hypothetical protein
MDLEVEQRLRRYADTLDNAVAEAKTMRLSTQPRHAIGHRGRRTALVLVCVIVAGVLTAFVALRRPADPASRPAPTDRRGTSTAPASTGDPYVIVSSAFDVTVTHVEDVPFAPLQGELINLGRTEPTSASMLIRVLPLSVARDLLGDGSSGVAVTVPGGVVRYFYAGSGPPGGFVAAFEAGQTYAAVDVSGASRSEIEALTESMRLDSAAGALEFDVPSGWTTSSTGPAATGTARMELYIAGCRAEVQTFVNGGVAMAEALRTQQGFEVSGLSATGMRAVSAHRAIGTMGASAVIVSTANDCSMTADEVVGHLRLVSKDRWRSWLDDIGGRARAESTTTTTS